MRFLKLHFTAILIISFLFFVSPTFAHKPIFIDSNISSYESAFEIKNPQISYAVYDDLAPGKVVKFFKLRLKTDEMIRLELLVPKPFGDSFKPSIGIMTEKVARTFPKVQRALLDTEEISIVQYTKNESVSFYEPFTQTEYFQHQAFNITTLNESTYFIAIFDPQATGGKYVLAVGNQESFGALDLVSFPYTYLRVKMWYGDYVILTGIIIGSVVLAMLILHKKNILRRILKWKLKNKRKKR